LGPFDVSEICKRPKLMVELRRLYCVAQLRLGAAGNVTAMLSPGAETMAERSGDLLYSQRSACTLHFVQHLQSDVENISYVVDKDG
jgi:hypothetical protein